ncbi:MAG: nucleoside/nucleotide kinase family protein, partial [Pseudomonadota bacterium]
MSAADPQHIDQVCKAIKNRAVTGRLMVAIAGAPASGKSTLAQAVTDQLNAGTHTEACLVPMDGFHKDNQILRRDGLLDRKGAPATFDVHGFLSMLRRLRARDEDVYVPLFDRTRDLAIAGAACIPTECRTVIVEGNYLLTNTPHWADAKAFFDLTIFLQVNMDVLQRR